MEVSELPNDKKIILFDGVCNLCDASVQFIITHDKEDVFRFVSLQSALGISITKYLGINVLNTDSIILYEPKVAYYYKSEAVFKIVKQLRGIYQLIGMFAILPRWLTDKVYDYVARNRYRWYGKKESCMIPSEELKSKFL